jgi:S-DNA-T family DNA segregation ATPase FtsK/SpoIIIE
MHLVLAYGGAAAEVELTMEDPEACVGDLTTGLDGTRSDDLGLRIDGRWFGPDIGLHEVGLYEGAVAEITRRVAERPPGPRATGLVLAVVGGPVAGRTYPIDKHDVTIGRDASCDIVLDDPSVSRRHASISANATITDLGSTNGTWIDDVPVTASTPLPPNALVRVGASHLRLRLDHDDDRPVGLPVGGFVPFNRPPRAALPSPLEPLVAPEAPKASSSSRAFGIAMIVGPVLMGAGMVVIYGNPRFALFAALGPIIAMVNWIASKRSSRKERRRHSRTFAAALQQFRFDLAVRAVDERNRREDELTDPAEVLRRATRPSVKLWQRRPADADFLRLRAGIGRPPWSPAVPAGRDAPPPEVRALLDEHDGLPRAPVDVDLSSGGVVGIVGERSMALALARSLVSQAAVHHGPADLGIAVFGAADWDWVKWLPHLEGDALAGEDDDRALLVVVDDVASIKGRRAPVRQLLQRQSGIVIAATEDQLPSMCTSIVVIRDDLGDAELRRPQDRLHIRELFVAGIDDATARECARSLARYEDPELELAGAGLTDVVRLLPLLGIDDPSPAAIREAWRHGEVDPSPSTPIGIGDEGVVHVDLVRDGPHGLVGGTTGSGKSELLRSLVAGMAARVDPEHLVFVLVDYKGGSAFDECSRLPHVVGLVTDLDEQLAERALRSLEAELRHRERTLREAGVPDLPTYLRSGSVRGPLPRLVVVIDEFATMATELPDFLGALVGIAQRGRSLGVHLLLATQRPSGAVNANIKANTNLRIALRVQDASESTDIVDRPSAATISRTTPGRAYLRRGPTDVVLAQTALATSPQRAGRSGPLRVKAFRRGPQADGEQLDDEGPSELTTLVDAIRGAFDGRPLPRRPWLPMLSERIELTDVPAGSPGVVAFAMADEPDQQRQAAVGWAPADGHLALFGMVGSGTTTAVLSVVEALVQTRDAPECHVYAIDYGPNGLAPLRALPHVGAVITANEREAQGRLVRFLRAEVDRRRVTGESLPRIVTCIDGVGAFLAEHEGLDGTEVSDAFRRIFSEGPAVGINFIVTADRMGALPLRLASLVSQKLLFRLADASDYSTLGLRAAQLPRFVPGRAVHSDGNRIVQVGMPSDLSALAAPRVAPSVGTLPTEVSASVLPAARLESPCHIPLGIGDDDLDVTGLCVHDGEHVLITGPPRSGKTSALALMARVIRAADPETVLVGVCEPRSLLHAVDAFDAIGSLAELHHIVRAATTDRRRWFVFVDDAPSVDDGDGVLMAALRSGRPDLHVVAAGRGDDVRAAYGHWLRIVRQSRTGVLLQPDLAADGDLLGVRLPRRLAVPLVPGRGFVVEDGQAALLQLAAAERGTS